MKKIQTMTTVMMVCLSVTLAACESKESPDTDAPSTSAPKTEATSPGGAKPPAATKSGSPNEVAVAAKGTEFEPAVDIAQMPDGAYYCDMGTVHYARMEEGDGKCGLCGMALEHAGSPPEGGADDHAGHEH